jgi:uncharacterized protein YqgC (DUF456 family)
MVGGWALVILGLAGLLLPVAPGVPLLIAGLALLAVDYPWARRWLDWVKARVARLRAGFHSKGAR